MIKKTFSKDGAEREAGYGDLNALFINCTLKKSPETSHTDTLMDVSRAIMRAAGASVESLRFVDEDIAVGVYPDMREHGWKTDAWPEIWKKVEAADILVVGTPIWLGQHSSECTKLIERLYAQSGGRNDKGQYVFYGKTAGCVVTGNEDGVKHVAMSVLYSLQHVGYAIPPQADCGWLGEIGPGPSYGDKLDDGSRAGFDSEFTQKNTTIMTWNLLHFARLLKEAGGVPAHGNTKDDWKKVFDEANANPEYR
ncbi:MAG: NAD(P)H-dependent oxidoreductase [Pseudomonadota bacterium]